MGETMIYLSLFVSALFSATLIPGQSEALLVGLLLAGHPPWLLVCMASIGNAVGSVANWVLGRGVEHFRTRKWFPVSPQEMQQAQRWYAKYGKWSLLASWMPVIGDPLTIVAGVMRERFLIFLLLVVVAKTGRYVVVAVTTLKLAG